MADHAQSRRSSASRRVGYLAAAAVNAVLIYLVNVWPGWAAVPFLTADTPLVLDLVNASLVVGVLVNLGYAAWDVPGMVALGGVSSTAVGLAALVRTWRVFPFDFGETSLNWALTVRVVLVVAIVGSAIAIVVHLVGLARAVVDARRPVPAPAEVSAGPPEAHEVTEGTPRPAGALVVYESLFGDAAAIARSIAQGLSETLPAEAVDVHAAPRRLGGLKPTLLVIGGPNHQFGMPRPQSREQAVRDFKAVVPDPETGLREWCADLEVTAPVVVAAAFDTRLEQPRFLSRVDHAAGTEEQLLRQAGATLLAPAEHFYVASPTGPLRDGERERAVRWGRTLAELATRGA